jgi:hypothetical protein
MASDFLQDGLNHSTKSVNIMQMKVLGTSNGSHGKNMFLISLKLGVFQLNCQCCCLDLAFSGEIKADLSFELIINSIIEKSSST